MLLSRLGVATLVLVVVGPSWQGGGVMAQTFEGVCPYSGTLMTDSLTTFEVVGMPVFDPATLTGTCYYYFDTTRYRLRQSTTTTLDAQDICRSTLQSLNPAKTCAGTPGVLPPLSVPDFVAALADNPLGLGQDIFSSDIFIDVWMQNTNSQTRWRHGGDRALLPGLPHSPTLRNAYGQPSRLVDVRNLTPMLLRLNAQGGVLNSRIRAGDAPSDRLPFVCESCIEVVEVPDPPTSPAPVTDECAGNICEICVMP